MSPPFQLLVLVGLVSTMTAIIGLHTVVNKPSPASSSSPSYEWSLVGTQQQQRGNGPVGDEEPSIVVGGIANNDNLVNNLDGTNNIIATTDNQVNPDDKHRTSSIRNNRPSSSADQSKERPYDIHHHPLHNEANDVLRGDLGRFRDRNNAIFVSQSSSTHHQPPRMVLIVDDFTLRHHNNATDGGGERIPVNNIIDNHSLADVVSQSSSMHPSSSSLSSVWDLPPKGVRTLKQRYVELRLSNPSLIKAADTLDMGDCQAVAPEWQLSNRPTCNLIQEAGGGMQQPYRYRLRDSLDVGQEQEQTSKGGEAVSWGPDGADEALHEQLRLVNHGAFRQVWKILDYDGVTKRAMKTLRAQAGIKSKMYDLRSEDRHRRDAIAFDQLHASPHVVDIYAYCSNTAIFDYADGGDLLDVFVRTPNITQTELLEIAYNVSMSVHDAHHFDALGRPTIAHTDIKVDQFIYQGGRYKLSDFNRARFLMWNFKRDLPCGFRVSKNGGEYRSPEEYEYKVETEKIDVFSLGNVLYFLLTRKEVWTKYQTKHAIELVKRGSRPVIPPEIYNNVGVFERYMIDAMEIAWIHDFRKRASAKDVANKIKEGLDILRATPSDSIPTTLEG